MITIKGIVRGGQIQIATPLDLPDGTELTITLNDDDFPETPEQIEEWIRWMHSLELLEFTPEERAQREAMRDRYKKIQLEVEKKQLADDQTNFE